MKFALTEGEKLGRSPNDPIIEVVKGPYLWIGNNAANDKFCFATLEGEEALRSLAIAILEAVDGKHKKRKGATPCPTT
jgi:hypothetical protein